MLIVLYALLLLALAWLETRVSEAAREDAFYVNGRSSGTGAVALSIIASCVGGSATLGMAGLAWQAGTPAFWWLGSGAAGLIVLTLFLARKVRASGVRTMPELLVTCLGAPSRRVASLIIVIAWMAILAAQYSALAAVIVSLAEVPLAVALWSGAGLVIAYSIVGGQAAVIKSDVVQFLLLGGGLLLVLGYLLAVNPEPVLHAPIEAVNASFGSGRLIYYMLILGGSYVVCPMLFGRLLSARDTRTARNGGLWAVVGLVGMAVLVVAIGLACRGLVPVGTAPEQVLTTAIGMFPTWVRLAALLALFSAVISSADSCLLTAATVCGNDLLPGPSGGASVHRVRLATLGLGLGGLLLASTGKGILGFLLMANDMYVCGVVAPVFVGMVCARKNTPLPACVPFWMVLAMVAGGTLGLSAAVTDVAAFSYAGIVASGALAVFGVQFAPGLSRRLRLHRLLRARRCGVRSA